MIVYPNNTEIQEFVTKAQNKIADLSTLYVERGGYLPDGLTLLLELSDFIECLDNPQNSFLEDTIISWIHVYNHRANLNEITFLSLTGVEVNIITGTGNNGLSITTSDISDYIFVTNSLIQSTQHNTLAGIQPVFGYPGAIATERYHINKAMYDYLYNLAFPYLAPTISLITTSAPINGSLLEMGVDVSNITLQGAFVLNSGATLQQYRYLKDGVVVSTVNPNAGDVVIDYTDYTPETLADITYTFEATFLNGGIKQVSKVIKFRQPMMAGVFLREQLQTPEAFLPSIVGTYYIGDRQNMNVTVQFPVGNSELSYNASSAMYIFIPESWGIPTGMVQQGAFNYINDWVFTNVTMQLGNGERGYTAPGIFGVFGGISPKGQIDGINGSTTFNMQF